MTTFQEGDTVRITHRGADHWPSYFWALEMDKAIGQTGYVVGDSDDDNYSLQVDGIGPYYVYPSNVLELVCHALLGHGPNNKHVAQGLPP